MTVCSASIDHAPTARHPDAPGVARADQAVALCAALAEMAGGTAMARGMAAPSAGLLMPLTVLWSRAHKFDAADAGWADRDRFVLSCARSTPLLHALLQLTGHQQGESGSHEPVLATFADHPDMASAAAPGGQAIAMAVGMALAERVLAGRFGKSLVDHRVWVVAEAAELAQGVTQEAVALAGQFRLDRLVLLADASGGSEDARARFASLGWAVKSVIADDPADVESALSFAARSRKPSLLWCVPGAAAPLGQSSPAALEAWRRVGDRGSCARRAWIKRVARHGQRGEFERVQAGRLPDALHELLATMKQHLGKPPALAGAAAPSAEAVCRSMLEQMEGAAPELLCGEAACAAQGGRRVFYSSRPHGMAACMNGIALHGGALPIGLAGVGDLIDQLPALRLAGRLGRRLVHLALDRGNAAPQGEAAEVLAWLRAMPQVHLLQPGCPVEAAECLELALRRQDGPSVVVLSGAELAALRCGPRTNRCAQGGYVLAEAEGKREATLIATGPGLSVALRARAALAARGVAAAVVSLPCWTLFEQQAAVYQRAVLGEAPRFGIDDAAGGWERWLNQAGAFLGAGVRGDQLAQAVRRRLAATA
jgi:transketolase